MAEPTVIPVAEGELHGYWGYLLDPVPNINYSVVGNGGLPDEE